MIRNGLKLVEMKTIVLDFKRWALMHREKLCTRGIKHTETKIHKVRIKEINLKIYYWRQLIKL
jgi:hypothetical protein